MDVPKCSDARYARKEVGTTRVPLLYPFVPEVIDWKWKHLDHQNLDSYFARFGYFFVQPIGWDPRRPRPGHTKDIPGDFMVIAGPKAQGERGSTSRHGTDLGPGAMAHLFPTFQRETTGGTTHPLWWGGRWAEGATGNHATEISWRTEHGEERGWPRNQAAEELHGGTGGPAAAESLCWSETWFQWNEEGDLDSDTFQDWEARALVLCLVLTSPNWMVGDEINEIPYFWLFLYVFVGYLETWKTCHQPPWPPCEAVDWENSWWERPQGTTRPHTRSTTGSWSKVSWSRGTDQRRSISIEVSNSSAPGTSERISTFSFLRNPSVCLRGLSIYLAHLGSEMSNLSKSQVGYTRLLSLGRGQIHGLFGSWNSRANCSAESGALCPSGAPCSGPTAGGFSCAVGKATTQLASGGQRNPTAAATFEAWSGNCQKAWRISVVSQARKIWSEAQNSRFWRFLMLWMCFRDPSQAKLNKDFHWWLRTIKHSLK